MNGKINNVKLNMKGDVQMKKKIYFILTSILQVIFTFYILFNANAIVQEEINLIPEMYSMFPIEFQQEMINIMETSGVTSISVVSIITILLNLYVLDCAICNKILRNKGKLIGISIFGTFMSLSIVNSFLSLISLIILSFSKRMNPEDYPVKEKKEMPKLEYVKVTKKEMILGIILICIYFLMDFIPVESFSDVTTLIVVPLYYVLLFLLAVLCLKDRLKRDIKIFKENSKAYFQYIMPRLGMMYIVYFIVSLICMLISQESSSINQAMLEEIPLFITIPLAIIWAPVVEEVIFREVLRNFIRNNKVFILVSALIFGLLHTLYEATIVNMIVLAIPYAFLGGFFAYIYTKTENIVNSIWLHMINNAIAIFLPLLFSIIF